MQDAVVEPGVDPTPAPADGYAVTILMSDATVDALAAGGFALQGFAAVRTTALDAHPLLWFRTEAYAPRTLLTWDMAYRACTFREDLGGAVTIRAQACYPIEPGQRLRVSGAAGTGAVFNDGEPGLIAIENDTGRARQAGVAIGAGPIAVAPVFGGGGVLTFDPQPLVLLEFSTSHREPGQAVGATTGPGILLELPEGTSHAVTFDIDDGFAGEGAGAHVVPAGSALAPLLNAPAP